MDVIKERGAVADDAGIGKGIEFLAVRVRERNIRSEQRRNQ